jgi:REP element-mobilizing transposase RayT
MARPLRIEYAGALYHVTARGDRCEDIYVDDEDRQLWLQILAQVCRRFNWRCHAWCQMDNHYHILIETAEGNLSQGMRQLNGVYTQKSNRRHERVGHVFQGRYKAILVERDSYLLELCRYIVLNPIRAGMVKNVGDWEWSSYHAMINNKTAPEWLETDWLLACFSKQRKRAINKYIDFVRNGIGLPSIWENLKYQAYLGEEAFVESMRQKLEDKDKATISEVTRLQRLPIARSLKWYKQHAGDVKEAMALAYLSGDYSMKEIAQWFDVHYSTVSRAVKLHEVNA